MKATLIAVGVGLTILLGACGKDPSAADFKAQTEKFLQSDKTVKPKLGQQFTNATCETPPSTAKGTQFGCTAVGQDDEQTYAFTVEITSKSNYTVTLSGTNDTTASTTATAAGSGTSGTVLPGSGGGSGTGVDGGGTGATTIPSGAVNGSGTGGAVDPSVTTTFTADSLPSSR
ncbi:MAG: hypothetical protein ABIR68_00875 [Ilumatobacteraceae bacterium]